MDHADIVIVGTGHGGAQAAIALRQNGFEGSIMMIGRDKHQPYERPPLSKEYLARDKPLERIWIRKPDFWDERDITLRLGAVVTKVDPAAHTVTLSGGDKVGYGKLIWSAGGDPRRLSCEGSHLQGIFSVRDLAHADEMRAQLDAGAKRAVVVGGGYIGLEAASVLIKMGCSVALVESQSRLLARVAGEDISAFFEEQHRARGVELYLNASVSAFLGEDGKLTGVRLDSGEELPADIAVVGIGIVPAVGPLIAAGATGANGVDVDDHCRTSLPDVYAIGDCAAHANPYADGSVVRLESVQNAHDMATTAAKDITGNGEKYEALPWFWSNQYDTKLQTAGLAIGYDEAVLRGDPAEGKFSVIYLKEGRVIAIDAVNMTRDYAQGRKLVEMRTSADPAVLADVNIPLKELL